MNERELAFLAERLAAQAVIHVHGVFTNPEEAEAYLELLCGADRAFGRAPEDQQYRPSTRRSKPTTERRVRLSGGIGANEAM
jgi:hypothetical protein